MFYVINYQLGSGLERPGEIQTPLLIDINIYIYIVLLLYVFFLCVCFLCGGRGSETINWGSKHFSLIPKGDDGQHRCHHQSSGKARSLVVAKS